MENKEIVEKIREEIASIICSSYMGWARSIDLGIFYGKIKNIVDYDTWIEANRDTKVFQGIPIADLLKEKAND